jgi:cobalt-zinc-cadmium efflux system outer membrane protein
MNARHIILSLLVVGGAGCTSFREDAGFEEVGQLVGDRVGKEVAWSTGGEEDKEVQGRMRTMLARELSADDVVQITLLNNLELQATYQELGIAQADVVQAGLLTNPTLSLERRFSGRATEADVTQSFLDVFLVPLRQRVAGANFEAAKLKVAGDVVEHAFDARLAYFELQAAMQLVEMRRVVAAASEASAESARRLREAGNTRAIDVQREELAAAEARLELATAEGEVVQNREQLNRLMGLWGHDTGWNVPSRLPELPADDAIPEQLEPIAVGSRLDLQSARRELEGLGESVGIAQITALIPDLTLTAHYEREPEGSSTTGPSVELPLPFFNWGRAASGQARARFIQAERRYAALAIEIRSHVRAAYARMGVARAKATYYRKRVLPLLEQALKQTQLLYNGMFIGVFELLEAKRSQVDAATKYIEALGDYWSARTELEAALGRTLPLPTQELSPSRPLPLPDKDNAHHHHHSH